MAINKTINKRTNTHGAMRNCIEYVLRQEKNNELFTCVTGPYCHDEINYDLVYRTFLEEKNRVPDTAHDCPILRIGVMHEQPVSERENLSKGELFSFFHSQFLHHKTTVISI